MPYLKGIYDSSSHNLMISFENNLVETQWDYLEKTILEASAKGSIPKEISLSHVGEGKCLITIPIYLEGTDEMEDGDRMDNLPPEVTTNLSFVLDNFVTTALSKEFSTVEFIPLSGYSSESMCEDLSEAIREKKDLLLVDSYRSYDMFSRRKIGVIKQKRVKFHTKEFAEVAIMIHNKDKKALNQLKNDLETVKWV